MISAKRSVCRCHNSSLGGVVVLDRLPGRIPRDRGIPLAVFDASTVGSVYCVLLR